MPPSHSKSLFISRERTLAKCDFPACGVLALANAQMSTQLLSLSPSSVGQGDK